MNSTRFIPTRVSSSTTYCTTGLRPTGSISFGCDLVAGSRRVPRPATGTTAMSMSMRPVILPSKGRIAPTRVVDDQLTIFNLVTARLEAAGIPYMVTGSIAAGHYAQPRMTRDIDLVVELTPADAERICAMFGDDFDCDIDAVRAAIARSSLFNLIHTTAVVKVDFVVRKDTPYRLAEFARRRHAVIDGHRAWIVSPEDLILSK